jgi:LacI family transcriptional regulator
MLVPMARITIDDVAARAGVSPTTVSHVYSGHRPVRDETRQLVHQAAQELGYRPNAVARSLRVRKTSTVMIVLPDITNPFYPVFARGVQDALRKDDYHVLLCNTDSRESEERLFLDEAVSRRLDGLVFMGYWVTTDELLEVAATGVSVVHLGQPADRATVDCVWSGDQVAAEQVTSYLLGRYGQSVAFIDGTMEAAVSRSRAAGYRAAFASAGHDVPAGFEITEDFTTEGGRRGMALLLAGDGPPRAVFCANDLMAIGALEEARRRGLTVPGDVAIAGYDDIDAARLVTPALTTVRNNPDLLGAACGELLLSRMGGDTDGAPREVLIQAELVIRESA